MKYHLFQKFFEKVVKIKETSFLLSKCLVSIAHHCSIVCFHSGANFDVQFQFRCLILEFKTLDYKNHARILSA